MAADETGLVKEWATAAREAAAARGRRRRASCAHRRAGVQGPHPASGRHRRRQPRGHSAHLPPAAPSTGRWLG